MVLSEYKLPRDFLHTCAMCHELLLFSRNTCKHCQEGLWSEANLLCVHTTPLSKYTLYKDFSTSLHTLSDTETSAVYEPTVPFSRMTSSTLGTDEVMVL